jgi:hypothetical protein
MRPVSSRNPRGRSRDSHDHIIRWDHGPTSPNRTVACSQRVYHASCFRDGSSRHKSGRLLVVLNRFLELLQIDSGPGAGSARIDPARRRCAHLAGARLQDALLRQRDATGRQHQLPGELRDARQTAGEHAGTNRPHRGQPFLVRHYESRAEPGGGRIAAHRAAAEAATQADPSQAEETGRGASGSGCLGVPRSPALTCLRCTRRLITGTLPDCMGCPTCID